MGTNYKDWNKTVRDMNRKRQSIWQGYIAANIICIVMWILLSLSTHHKVKGLILLIVVIMPASLLFKSCRDYYRKFPL